MALWQRTAAQLLRSRQPSNRPRMHRRIETHVELYRLCVRPAPRRVVPSGANQQKGTRRFRDRNELSTAGTTVRE